MRTPFPSIFFFFFFFLLSVFDSAFFPTVINRWIVERRHTSSTTFIPCTHTSERERWKGLVFSYYSFYSFRGSITSQSRRIANGVSSRSTRMNNEGKFISRIGTHRIVEDDANCFTRATQEFSVERHQVAASSWMDHSPRHSQPHVVHITCRIIINENTFSIT